MKGNGLLKWLIIPVALTVIFILFKSGGKNTGSTSHEQRNKLTAEEMRALGIEGDTPQDTIATLVGQVKQLRGELKQSLSDNHALKTEYERLRQRENDVDNRIKTTFQSERERLQAERKELLQDKDQTHHLLRELQHKFDGLNNKNNDIPVGLGLDEKIMDEQTIWIGTQGVIIEDKKYPSTSHFTTGFQPQTHAGEKIRHENVSTQQAQLIPVYTLPAGSTLMGSIAMTALIGRIPINGTVNDPYPFKVVVGPDNLAANGMELPPNITGAIMSGTASGDWTLSCVRGEINSITFVFSDGTIRSIPKSSEGDSNNKENLGYLSDPHGIPCVSGERKSNAQQYLTTQSLITAAGAGVASLLSQDDKGGNSGYTNNGASSDRNGALNTILSGGVEDIRSWVNKLYGQAFAAVYVKPGAQVAVHLSQQLNLDYNNVGRKLNHKMGATYAKELD